MFSLKTTITKTRKRLKSIKSSSIHEKEPRRLPVIASALPNLAKQVNQKMRPSGGCTCAHKPPPPKDQGLILGRPKNQYMILGAIVKNPLVKNEPRSKNEYLNLKRP